MEKIRVKMAFTRATKNTHRFEEIVGENEAVKIGVLYVKKSAINSEPPKVVTVTVEGD